MSLGPVFRVYYRLWAWDWWSWRIGFRLHYCIAAIINNRAQFFPIIAERTQVSVCFGVFAIVSFFGQIFIYAPRQDSLRRDDRTQISELDREDVWVNRDCHLQQTVLKDRTSEPPGQLLIRIHRPRTGCLLIRRLLQ
jgi:hypothetical protein